jgi:hypothetical protein
LRNHHRPRYSMLLGAVALSSLTLALSLAWAVPATFAAGPANPEANELVRLINGERAYLGKAPLRTDTFLAAKARDGAVACPNDASKVMEGRAKDFAVFGFPANAHLLRLCPTYSSMDAMKEWGYNGGRGEITALNGGYGTGAIAYNYGCNPSVRTCPGPATSTYYTTDRAMTNWTSSATHYAIIIGNYDRVGCGAWVGSNGAYYYDCMFSRGGRSAPKAASRPAGGAAAAGTGTPLPSATPELTASPSPTPSPTSIVDAAQATDSTSARYLALALTTNGGSQSDPPIRGAGAPVATENLSVAAGAITALFSLCYGLVLAIKRRRGTGQLAI